MPSIHAESPPVLEELDGIEKEQAVAFAQRLAPGMELGEHFVRSHATFVEPERWRVETEAGEALDVWIVSVPRGVVFRAGTTTQVGEIFDARMTHTLAELSLLPDAAARHPEGSLLSRFGRRALRVREAEEAGTPVTPPPGPPFEGEIAPGTLAFAQWKGRWWPAQILSKSGERYRIHYDGWGSNWDEYVPATRLCQAPPPVHAEVGDPVSVEYRGAWYAARVLEVHEDGRMRVTYDGWDAGWDEDVVPARVKKPTSGPAGDPGLPGRPLGAREVVAGMPVFIAYDGAWYEGSVLEVKEGDGYLIHYDGWEASWDEVVDESRLRLRDVPVAN
jgi:hypothetical protein